MIKIALWFLQVLEILLHTRAMCSRPIISFWFGLYGEVAPAQDVRLMKIELGQKEVKLVEAAKETDVLLVEITESTSKAQKKQAEVYPRGHSRRFKQLLVGLNSFVSKGFAQRSTVGSAHRVVVSEDPI